MREAQGDAQFTRKRRVTMAIRSSSSLAGAERAVPLAWRALRVERLGRCRETGDEYVQKEGNTTGRGPE